MVGVQATLNIVEGERYKRVPDEVKKYALGYYGKLLAPVAPDVLDRIVTNGAPSIALTPPTDEPVVAELQRQFPGADGDELLLRSAFPPHLLEDKTPEPEAHRTRMDIGALVNALLNGKDLGSVRIETGRNVAVTLDWQ